MNKRTLCVSFYSRWWLQPKRQPSNPSRKQTHQSGSSQLWEDQSLTASPEPCSASCASCWPTEDERLVPSRNDATLRPEPLPSPQTPAMSREVMPQAHSELFCFLFLNVFYKPCSLWEIPLLTSGGRHTSIKVTR